ncbi:MAG: redox-sensitive bicupin YhaK (pirin superfamily) [Gammaproteobacteria bacterium]|jgi:redox-sensitive bicupin YhaK (pirin superfamily)
MTESIESPCSGIRAILQATEKDLGGFSVRRYLPHRLCKKVGPFVFFDHMGPAIFKSGDGIDVRPHPHIGLATITYLFEGEIIHRDNLGYVQAIQPGALNLMTSGKGIVHSERTSELARQQGQTLHGLQVWVALPEEFEEVDPDFLHYENKDLPIININGAEIRIIIGTAFQQQSPVKTYSPLFYLDVDMPDQSSFILPDDYPERAIHIISGEVEVNGNALKMYEMAVLERSENIKIIAKQDSRLVIFGGDVINDRHLWWNFVSSSKERIDVAKQDWKSGHFGNIPGETEYIPLPEDS